MVSFYCFFYVIFCVFSMVFLLFFHVFSMVPTEVTPIMTSKWRSFCDFWVQKGPARLGLSCRRGLLLPSSVFRCPRARPGPPRDHPIPSKSAVWAHHCCLDRFGLDVRRQNCAFWLPLDASRTSWEASGEPGSACTLNLFEAFFQSPLATILH